MAAQHHVLMEKYFSRADIMQLLLECAQSRDQTVCHAALTALHDAYLVFGDALLPYTSREAPDSKNNLMALLLIKSCSPQTPKAVAKTADVILKTISEGLHQQSVLYILEPFTMQWDN